MYWGTTFQFPGNLIQLAIPGRVANYDGTTPDEDQLNYIFHPWLRYYYKNPHVNDNYVVWIFSFCYGFIVIFKTIVWGFPQ